MINWFKIFYCKLFHKHEYRRMLCSYIFPTIELMKGCKKCDLWEVIKEPDDCLKENN